jgi:3-phosphoshikimate 1-carboxyvinyltransferase
LTVKGISASFAGLTKLMSQDGATAEDQDGNPVLHVGESGLLTRMMIPVMAQLRPESVDFTGEKTLLNRPLTGAREIMEAMGASIECSSQEAVCVPLTVKGPLKPGRAEVSGKHGSQLISGLLMALPFADRNSTLVVKEPKSIPYMFITLEVLKKFGIKVANEMLGGRDFLESDGDWSLCTEMVFKVKGGQKYKAADIDLEGDWSAAANFLVAGAVFGKTEIAGLDTTSLQADLSIMDILMDAGASLSQLDGNKGNITAQRAPLRAFNVDASNCPDLFPIISVLAAFCQGTSRLAGVGRLANKESDRAKAIQEMLTQMGVSTHIEGDEMVIEGQSLVERLLGSAQAGNGTKTAASGVRLLKGGEYTSHHDHRMVMALKVAALGADSPITIDDESCVSKSFPQFLEMFEKHLSC